MEGRLPNLSAPKTYSIRQMPVRGKLQKLGLRATKAWISAQLVTIHPNPGPGGRDKSEVGLARRRERRKESRRLKRER